MSDAVYDFTCSPCEDDNLNTEASCYCNQCLKHFCNKCVQLHNLLYKSHTVLGKDKRTEWGFPEAVVTCLRHGHQKLEMFCDDHDAVCCLVCVSTLHR